MPYPPEMLDAFCGDHLSEQDRRCMKLAYSIIIQAIKDSGPLLSPGDSKTDRYRIRREATDWLSGTGPDAADFADLCEMLGIPETQRYKLILPETRARLYQMTRGIRG